MPEPQAYFGGRFVPASQVAVSIADAGFVQGTTVAEQLRTFGGRLFELEAHIERLFRSLAIIQVDPGQTARQFAEIARELVARNHPLLPPGHDLGLTLFVTPGIYSAMVAGEAAGATVCLHTFPLRFELWSDKYARGESLATTTVRQVPAQCWPVELKCRSRMHYFLADQQARARYPGSRALLLDEEDCVTETTTANLVLYHADAGLLSPPAHKILPGISLAVLLRLADQLSIPHAERLLTQADVAASAEAFITSTSPCMLPVVRFEGLPIGTGRPGAVFARLLASWSELVGLDIMAQARQFAAV